MIFNTTCLLYLTWSFGSFGSFGRSLVKLNLSYNQINDISGFEEMTTADYRLSHLELHGNRLNSLNHVTQCLSKCVNLRSLAVAHAGADNPFCQTPGEYPCNSYLYIKSWNKVTP